MDSNPKERRLFPRFGLSTSLRYQIRGTQEYSNVICDDISLGGVGFVNNEFLRPGALVLLEIKVMSKVLHPIGKISRSQPLTHSNRFKVGMQFVEFDPIDKGYLSDYIHMRLEQS